MMGTLVAGIILIDNPVALIALPLSLAVILLAAILETLLDIKRLLNK